MSKQEFKKFAAIALSAAMIFGSAFTAFADEAGTGTGEGTYEGGELKYPTLSVTLPTIPEDTYDYIADPNDLIEKTNHEKYGDAATFSGDTGIYFKTVSGNDYSETSDALEVKNENAQDSKVTVKMEVSKAGDKAIKYANSANFTSEDNELYLAIATVSGGDIVSGGDAGPVALSTSGTTTSATASTTVAGVPENYEPRYVSSGDGYGYYLKDSGLVDWNSCFFALTGALNKNAKWGDTVTFPEIKITWSYAEVTDSVLSSNTISSTSKVLTVAEGVTVTKVTLVKTSGAESNVQSGTYYIFADGKLTINGEMLANNVGGKIRITFDNGKTEEVSIVK